MVHLGIIPDGNRRWGKAHANGHEGLTDAWLGQLCDAARDYPGSNPSRWSHLNKVTELSLYICSVDNLRRSDDTMTIIYKFLRGTLPVFIDWHNQITSGFIRVNVIGNVGELEHDVRDLLRKLSEVYSSEAAIFTLNLAIAYDYERDVKNHGTFGDPEYDTRWMSQMDIVLRTGGDKRLSGFFPTKTFYAEFFFLKKFWPELTLDDLNRVIRRFSRRTRRFGT